MKKNTNQHFIFSTNGTFWEERKIHRLHKNLIKSPHHTSPSLHVSYP